MAADALGSLCHHVVSSPGIDKWGKTLSCFLWVRVPTIWSMWKLRNDRKGKYYSMFHQINSMRQGMHLGNCFACTLYGNVCLSVFFPSVNSLYNNSKMSFHNHFILGTRRIGTYLRALSQASIAAHWHVHNDTINYFHILSIPGVISQIRIFHEGPAMRYGVFLVATTSC